MYGKEKLRLNIGHDKYPTIRILYQTPITLASFKILLNNLIIKEYCSFYIIEYRIK